MNWDDPTERARLAEALGPADYNEQFALHLKSTTIATANGYDIRPVPSRFGRLFAVVGTDRAFSTKEQAEAHAQGLPTGSAG